MNFKNLSLIFVFICLFLLFGCNNKNDLVLSGTIEASSSDIFSEKAGKVVSFLKNEFDNVLINDDIISIDSTLQSLTIKQQEAVVLAKKAVLNEIKSGTRQEQINRAEAQMRAFKAKYEDLLNGSRPEQISSAQSKQNTAMANFELANSNLNLLTDKYNNTKDLFEKGFASKDALDDIKYKKEAAEKQKENAQNALNQATSELELLKNGSTAKTIEAAKASYDQAKAEFELLKNGATKNAITQAEADLAQSEAQLLQAKTNFDKYIIKSPITGTITSYNISIGEIINVGSNIGTVTNLSELYAYLYIPQKYLSKIKLGDELFLTSDATSNKIKGQIVSINQIAEYTPKNIETNEAKENTVFKFKVKILDNINALKPGMNIYLKMSK